MKSLKEIIQDTGKKGAAVGHFNISDLVTLKAIFLAAKELSLPVIVGTSEGERDFIGVRQAAALVKNLREEYDFPIFINADHTRSLDKVKEASEAGYDSIIFDGAVLSFEENVRKTREAVELVKSKNPDILVEGELGYIGSSSELLKEMPKGAAADPETFTKPEQAKEFVERTGVDLFAPAVGNIHGMYENIPNPNLDIQRIREIKEAAGVPLVLHGGSGIRDKDFIEGIKAGISIIHISTELRFAWRKSLEKSLKDNPDVLSPYKIQSPVVEAVKEVVLRKLRLFSGSQP